MVVHPHLRHLEHSKILHSLVVIEFIFRISKILARAIEEHSKILHSLIELANLPHRQNPRWGHWEHSKILHSLILFIFQIAKKLKWHSEPLRTFQNTVLHSLIKFIFHIAKNLKTMFGAIENIQNTPFTNRIYLPHCPNLHAQIQTVFS